MKRRNFIKTISLVTATLLLGSSRSFAQDSNLDSVVFDEALFNDFNSQTIVIFLYGGASELGGNMTNIEQINELSQNKYSSNDLEVTENGFWVKAGGELMESMIDSNSMSIVRTITRKSEDDTKSHQNQQEQNLRGTLDNESSGIFRNISSILHKNGKITKDTVIGSISIGQSDIFYRGDLEINHLLREVTINKSLANPYSVIKHDKLSDTQVGVLKNIIDRMNQANSNDNKFVDMLKKHYFNRIDLSSRIESIKEQTLPIEFPNTDIGYSLSSVMKVMLNNVDTKLAFIEYPENWDDHSSSVSQYQSRHYRLIEALNSASQLLETSNNKSINIWVMTEFGRNVNLNNSYGWDHGNLFNLMVVSKNPKLNMGQIIGTTTVSVASDSRLFTVPADDSVSFEPFSIAASIYKIFGIINPESISGYQPINELFIN